jgi:hypothetical protein
MTLYRPYLSEVKTLSFLSHRFSYVSSSLEVSCTCHFMNVAKVLFCSQVDILISFSSLNIYGLQMSQNMKCFMSFEELKYI